MYRITFVLLLALFTLSCKKKDDLQPSTLPTGGSGGTTTFSKIVQFIQRTNETDVCYVYVSKIQSDLGTTNSRVGTLYGQISTSTQTCGFDSNLKKTLTESGKYYYQLRRGNSVITTIAFEGYFDVDANGTITVTQTLKPSTGSGIVYSDCGNSQGSFTVYYR